MLGSTYKGQINIGADSIVHSRCVLNSYSSAINIGNRCTINSFTVINSNISIGDDVHIGSHVYMNSDSHNFKRRNVKIVKQGMNRGRIVVESDVWIGSGVNILNDIKISKGAVVGVGSVVNKDVPEYAIVAGVPAKIIKYRNND